jgi:hypothetical protein
VTIQSSRAVERLDRRTRPGRSRGGQGTLLLVICIFMAVGFIVGIARHFLSTQVRNNAQGAAIGSLAVEIARSAIQEAYYKLQVQLDDLENQGNLKPFRSESGPPQQFPALSFDPQETRKALATDPLLGGFEIVKDVSAQFVASHPLRAVPYEYVGLFRFQVQVNHKPTGVRRAVQIERTFKMCLLSTPRPFDQFTLSVLQPENLWGYGDANGRLRDILKIRNDLRSVDLPKMNEMLLDVINGSGGRKGADSRLNDAEGAGLSTKKPFTPGAKVNYYAKGGLVEILKAIQAQLDQNAQLVPLQFETDVTKPWHFLPGKVVISTKAETIPFKSGAQGAGTEPLPGAAPMDLSFLNLSKRLNNQITRTSPPGIDSLITSFQKHITEYTDEVNAINKLVQKSFDVSSQSQAQQYIDESDSRQLNLKRIMQDLERDMTALDVACYQFEEMVKNFTDFFIESADEAADWIRGFAYKFQRAELDAKATYKFESKVDGMEAGDRFLAFLKSYNKDGDRALNGIVLIDNLGGAPLNLSQLQVNGKLVIACTGDVNISDVTLAKPEDNLLTIQCDGQMRVSGRVEASLVPRGQFVPAASAKLSGNLILDLIDNPDQMMGSVENPHIRDAEHGRYFSGVTSKTSPYYTYASWTPWQSWAEIKRN